MLSEKHLVFTKLKCSIVMYDFLLSVQVFESEDSSFMNIMKLVYKVMHGKFTVRMCNVFQMYQKYF